LKPTRLVLFDIDGTILTTHRRAWEFPFSDAIRKVLDIPLNDIKTRAGGKTDPQIVHEILADSGLSEAAIDAAMPAIRQHYLERIRVALKDPEDVELKPGIRAAIAALQNRPEVVLGLLTGNFEEGARIKLGVHDLNGPFPFGAFGDDAKERVMLPPKALAAAEKYTGIRFLGKDAVIIGDTPNDILCGRPLNIRTIAVATGPYQLEELRAEKPDFLFETLEDAEKLVQAVLTEMRNS